MKRMIWGITVSVLAAGSADAALLSRAGGQAYYDTALNITWLADANYAKTSGYDSNGSMTWDEAQTWIVTLNSANHLGVNDWRLPETAQPDPSCSIQAIYDGWGYGCTGSEMGHLFNVDGISSATPGPFSNVRSGYSWSGTEHAPVPGHMWDFAFGSGYQSHFPKDSGGYAWAVRPGDIGAVPAPGALWLFGTGLAALGAKLKRRVRATGTGA